MSLERGRFTARAPTDADSESVREAAAVSEKPGTPVSTRTNKGAGLEATLNLNIKRTPDERDVRALTRPTVLAPKTAETTATKTTERARNASEGPLVARLIIGPSGPTCILSSGPSALGPVRKLCARSRQLALANIVSAVSHCHALAIDVAVHAELTLVSHAGHARISLDAVPDARYSSPETLFAVAQCIDSGPGPPGHPCVAWALACLLTKLITGKPLVRDGSRNAQTARILSLVGALRVRDAHLAALFDALDATQWKGRLPKLAVVPPHATARERDVIRASLRWTNRPPLDAFRLTRPAHSPSLSSTAEEEE